jgi:hypothetical protein
VLEEEDTVMRSLLLVVPLALTSAGPSAAADPPQQQARLAGPEAVVPGAARHPAEAVDIGALTLSSDFTVFMRRDCPEPLRRSALRKLWSHLPQLNDTEPTTF